MSTRIGFSQLFPRLKQQNFRISDDERQNSPLIQSLLNELSVAALVVDLGTASAVATNPHIEHFLRQGIKVSASLPTIHENMHSLNTFNPARIVMITNASESVKDALTMGCWAVAVTKTEDSEAECQRKNAAHYKIPSLSELASVISDINSQLNRAILPHAPLPNFLRNPLLISNEKEASLIKFF